jgi:hypothetical protein
VWHIPLEEEHPGGIKQTGIARKNSYSFLSPIKALYKNNRWLYSGYIIIQPLVVKSVGE